MNKNLLYTVNIISSINRSRTMKFLHKIFFLSATAASLFCGGCSSVNSTEHIPSVTNFDLNRYLGVWYEIARLPHSFERDVVNAQAEYILLPNGKIRVINRGTRNGKAAAATGIALIADKPDTGELAVSFFRPFYGTYRIIYLDNDYQLAIVTSDTMDYLWILARKPVITPEKLDECLNRLREWGFAVKLLQYPNGLPQ